MAAQTGKWVPITGGPIPAGIPQVFARPEASAQVNLVGAPVRASGGYVSAETQANPAVILGFARVAGQNGASDGAKTASYYKARVDALFSGTLSATLSQSHFGLALNIVSNASSQYYLNTLTSISSAAQARCAGWNTTLWATGDVNPEVLFTLIPSVIQGDF